MDDRGASNDLQPEPAAGGCLSDDTIDEFLNGSRSAAVAERVESHIDDCPACRRQLSALAELPVLRSFLGESSEPEQGGEAEQISAQVFVGDRLGRYIVLDQLGSGGIGVVATAYDPELDRKVALKLIKPRYWRHAAARARELLRREAQAMARLSHPNVVSVYDVGTYRDQVFVAMELIDGTTLRRWLGARARPWRQALERCLAAGRGLAAAHAAGLVHRDVKPDNVLISSDGRVMVADFGLATLGDQDAASSESGSGSGAGTPAYMAPEQHGGEAGDARSDQFGFCVTVFEALYGTRPFPGTNRAQIAAAIAVGNVVPPPSGTRVPRRVRRVLLRGLAADPGERFPDMDALLAALSAASRWPRPFAAALATLTIAGAVAAALAFGAARDRPAPRAVAAAELAKVWNAEHRERIRKAFDATKRPHAASSYQRVAAALERYGRAWVSVRTAGLESTTERSSLLFDRRVSCLERRLDEMTALIAVFERADAHVIDRGVRAALALTPVEVCGDDAALMAAVPPPENPAVRAQVAQVRRLLEQARARLVAADFAGALERASTAERLARRAGYAPALAEALLIRAGVDEQAGQANDAERHLRQALQSAATAGDDSLIARAWVALIGVVGVRQARYDEARTLHAAVELALARAGNPAAEAARSSNIAGNVHLRTGKYADALGAYERALALRERHLGKQHLQVGETLSNIGAALGKLGRLAEAVEALQRARAIFEAELGPDHPHTAAVLNNLANRLYALQQFERAAQLNRRALAIRERVFGPRNPVVATSLNNVGLDELRAGNFAAAGARFERAAEIVRVRLGADHPRRGRYLANLAQAALGLGETAKTQQLLGRALAIREQRLGGDHPLTAETRAELGRTLLLNGDARAGLSHCERALAAQEKRFGPDSSQLAVALACAIEAHAMLGAPARGQSLIARARRLRPVTPAVAAVIDFAEATLLWRSPAARQRARQLAEKARAGFATMRKYAVDQAVIRAWLQRHRAPPQ